MRRFIVCLTILSHPPCSPHALFAADPKWIHATSEHFDMYTAESEGDAKAALQHLEAVRAYFLAATHSKDPGGQPVRIVAFHSAENYRNTGRRRLDRPGRMHRQARSPPPSQWWA